MHLRSVWIHSPFLAKFITLVIICSVSRSIVNIYTERSDKDLDRDSVAKYNYIYTDMAIKLNYPWFVYTVNVGFSLPIVSNIY